MKQVSTFISDNTYVYYMLCQSKVMAVSDESGNPEQSLSGVYPDLLVLNTSANSAQTKVKVFGNAWGRRRSPENWNSYDLIEEPLFDRGYTGHEHLDEFGLINMNGRMYDPVLGQMLSPDNFVQNATNGQNYNRYTYVMNNPLKYTDPTGENHIGEDVVYYIDGMRIDGSFAEGAMIGAEHITFYGSSCAAAQGSNLVYSSHERQQFNQGYKEIEFFRLKGNYKQYKTDMVNSNNLDAPPPGGGTMLPMFTVTDTWEDWYARNYEALKDVIGWDVRQMKRGAQSGGGCPNCLDPKSIGNNLLGLSYPGANNPTSRSLQDNFSYIPSNLAEYPAIGHDRRYINLKINGASGLFLDPRAIGADWKFVGEEFAIATNPYINPVDRLSAGVLGVGLGLASLPKTLLTLSTGGLPQVMMWYNASSVGVTNKPTPHKH